MSRDFSYRVQAKEVSRHIKAMLVVGLETIQEEDGGEGKKIKMFSFPS